MKILLAIHYDLDTNSGASGSTAKLAECYQDYGHEVNLYSTNDLPRKLIPGRVRRMLFSPFLAFHTNDLVKRCPVDVVDASTGDAWLWAKFFKKENKDFPLLVTRSHGLEHLEHLEYLEEARNGNIQLSWKYPLYNGSLLLWQVAESFRRADIIFLLNRAEAKFLTERMSIDPKKIYVFPNGIPESFLGLPFVPLSPSQSSSIKIAQIGTYIPRKGIQYAKPAISSILNKYPNVEITFLGTECFECSSLDQVYADFEPKLHNRIHVIPRYEHSELPSLLQDHHIKLFPTISEGFGKALVEAMACGLAPITTTAPGPLDIVENHHDGLIVPIRNSQAIEEAIESLILNPNYLEHLRKNAYDKAQSYSWKTIAKNRLLAYEEAIEINNHYRKTS